MPILASGEEQSKQDAKRRDFKGIHGGKAESAVDTKLSQ